jgi:hypothetical protein
MDRDLQRSMHGLLQQAALITIANNKPLLSSYLVNTIIIVARLLQINRWTGSQTMLQ